MSSSLSRILRIILTVITLSTGVIILLSFIIDHPILSAFRGVLVEWVVILVAFAMLLGVGNVLRVHAQRIQKRQGAFYSLILIISFLVVFIPGIFPPAQVAEQTADYVGPNGQIVRFVYQYIQRPLQATLFSLMAFFAITAAWRAFKLRSAASWLMGIAAILVLLGSIWVDIGGAWQPLVEIKDWILQVPAMAGARGILLGITLGIIIAGIRLLLGIERPYSD